MARRRSGSSRGKASASTSPRRARSKSKSAPAPAASAEVVEEEGGEGMDTGIAVITTVVLVAAFLFVDALRGQYDTGMFF